LLAGVRTVSFDVHDIVECVRSRSGQAERAKCAEDYEEVMAVAEHSTGKGGHHHEQVLYPLAGASKTDETDAD
jgi:hypothetical protein